MKKRILSLVMAAMLLCTMLLTSCGEFDYTKEDLSQYIELGNYKGLSFTKTEPKTVDEAAIAEYLKTTFSEFATLEDAGEDVAAKEGDTVNIDYVGKLNGEEFEGGSGNSTDLELGSDKFIDGFEDGLIGAKKGEKKTLNLKFPEDYGNEELNGKDVVFEVTVNAVKTTVYEYDSKIAEGTVLKNGDVAIITYSGKIDGMETFENSEGTDVSVVVGDEEDDLFIPAFTAALASMKVGESDRAITIQYPADYENTELAGKTAVYTVSVKSATVEKTVSEIDDDFIASNTESETLAKYTEDVITPELNEQYALEAKVADYSGIWKMVLDGATVKSYPSKAVKDAAESIYDYYAGVAGAYYGMSIREYAKAMGYSLKEFKAEMCQPQAEDVIKEKLVLNAIIKAENISLTAEEEAAGLKAHYENADLGLSSS